MFVWTSDGVLAAIDAGIAEVIAAYNNSYLFFVRKHVHIATAYDYAMSATVDWLNRAESERLLLAGVDAAIETIEVTGFEALADGADKADLFHPTQIVQGFIWAAA